MILPLTSTGAKRSHTRSSAPRLGLGCEEDRQGYDVRCEFGGPVKAGEDEDEVVPVAE